MSGYDHKRWKIGPFASGAYSETGGHWKALGLMRSWIPHPSYDDVRTWCVVNEFSLFGILACRWGDGRFQWALFSAEIKFTRARWRYGKRDEARQRRSARRRYEKAVIASRLTNVS